MKVQVLVAATDQDDYSFLEKANIQSDVIVGNQCNKNSIEQFEYNGHDVVYMNTDKRGVGLNRNLTLNNSTGDIIIFADDDIRYVDNYPQIIKEAFKEIPKADVIIFNIETIGKDFNRRQNGNIKRVRFYNALNYGTSRIAAKSQKVKNSGIQFNTNFGGGCRIQFNTNFGGGCPFGSGEDTLFICDMLRKGLKIYTYPFTLLQVDQTTSSWFNGYTKKYFYDKGVLYKAISKTFGALLCLQDVLRHYGEYKEDSNLTKKEILSIMKKGRKGYKNLIPYKEN